MNEYINRFKKLNFKVVASLLRWFMIVSLLCVSLYFHFRLNLNLAKLPAFLFSIMTGYFLLLCRAWKRAALTIFALISPLLSLIVMESWIGNIDFHSISIALSPQAMILNLVGYVILATVLFLIFRRWNWSSSMLIALTYVFGFINHLVFLARGRILTPQDLFALPTAWRVLNSYRPLFSTQILVSTIIGFTLLATISFALNDRNQSRWNKNRAAIFLLVVLFGLGSFFLTPLPDRLGLQDGLWDSMWTAKSSGALLDFMVNLRYSRISKPQGYTDEMAMEIMNHDTVGFSNDQPMDFFYSPERMIGSCQKPHLIVIMNESFSDLSVLGDISYSEKPLTFFDSWKNNSMMNGEVIAPALGGHTANTEFEFLTGQSCAFLPAQTVPFIKTCSGFLNNTVRKARFLSST